MPATRRRWHRMDWPLPGTMAKSPPRDRMRCTCRVIYLLVSACGRKTSTPMQRRCRPRKRRTDGTKAAPWINSIPTTFCSTPICKARRTPMQKRCSTLRRPRLSISSPWGTWANTTWRACSRGHTGPSYRYFFNLEMRDWKSAAALEPVAGARPETQLLTYWARTVGAGHLRQPEQARANLSSYDSLMVKVNQGSHALYADSTGTRI